MFYEKISLLLHTTLNCFDEKDELRVIKAFTDLGVKILDASFGFVWLNSYASNEFVLVYKSKATPYTPQVPRKDGRNFHAIKTGVPHFITDITTQPDMERISSYMKSQVIIPITYSDKAYGSIVLCFKKKELFSKEMKTLCAFIGNTVAQAITIRRLLQEQQERPKTEFLAEATHELRTPLAIIRGSVDLALQAKTVNRAEITRTLNDINYEVNHMSVLVSDLALLVNSGGSFKRKLMSHDTSLENILRRTIQRLEGYAEKKKITFHLEKVPVAVVTGDELYLDKMFGNIIRNAITYGKNKGKVTIQAAISGSKENPIAHIDITDNGIGIPKADISKIFDRFYRSENARAVNHEGTGLGLAIVRFIAEAHGGAASILSSREGSGTTFRISLPVTSK